MSDEPKQEPSELTPEEAKLAIKAIEDAEHEEAQTQTRKDESKTP